MHTMRPAETPQGEPIAGQWMVGYFTMHPANDGPYSCSLWTTISGPHDQDEAARRVNYLNGGTAKTFLLEECS